MRQNDLNRAVARATGESVSTVRHLGFGLAEPNAEFTDTQCEQCVTPFETDPVGPRVIDWDAPSNSPVLLREYECAIA